MRRINLYLFYCLAFGCLLPVSAFAQTATDQSITQLTESGFENIRVIQLGNEVIGTIERGLYRSPVTDFKQAHSILEENFPGSDIRIFLLEQGQAVYQLDDAKNSEIDISYADQDLFSQIKEEQVARPVNRGVSIVVYPQLIVRNNTYDQIYETQFNIAPALEYSGWQGMKLTAQLIFPVINELGYSGDYIRPGFLTLSQTFQLPKLNVLKATIGNFNFNRYGADLKWWKYLNNSRWSFRAQIGLTGSSVMHDWYWKHSSLNRISWNVTAGYYYPKYQLQADFSIGQFIAGNEGTRVDIYRRFGEVTIGFYATYAADTDPNGGFHFAIPIDPFTRKHKKRIQLRLPSYYDNEYSFRDVSGFNGNYETSPTENRSNNNIYPQFISDEFENLKNY